MKKKLNDFFDEAKAEELDLFSNSLKAPELSPEVLASIKNRVYAKTDLSPKAKNNMKTQKETSRTVWLRVGALAACLGLIITSVFGVIGFFGREEPEGTSNVGDYPDYAIYENMSMTEYMNLHPDFLAYRSMPLREDAAFAHLEILEICPGYEAFKYVKNQKSPYMYSGSYTLIRCRVVDEAWGQIEPGTEIGLFVKNAEDVDFLSGFDSCLAKMLLSESTFYFSNTSEEFKSGRYYSSVSGDQFEGSSFQFYPSDPFNCFPLVDGKVQLERLEDHLKEINFPREKEDVDVKAELAKVESMITDGMTAETAMENQHSNFKKFQTGEYHNILIECLVEMNYGEYRRMIEGTLTQEDFDKFDQFEHFDFVLEYAMLPGLVSREFSLSDGTKFEISTRIEIHDSVLPYINDKIEDAEKKCTDKNGVLDVEACIKEIKHWEWYYSYQSIVATYPRPQK